MTGQEGVQSPYVCPQCGPDPAGAEEHARTHHTFAGVFDEPAVLHVPCTCADDRSDGRGFAQHWRDCPYGIAEAALVERGHRINTGAPNA